MNQIIRYIYMFFGIMSFLFLGQACTDESLSDSLDYTSVGEDVQISVPVEIPAMSVQTRASISDQNRDELKSLWVATFNESGEMTSSKTNGGEPCWIKIEESHVTNEPATRTVKLWTKTGPSHIVAVGNLDNLGVKSVDDEPKKLRELLTDNMTWSDFTAISVVNFPTQDDSSGDGDPDSNTDAPDVLFGLPMSGCFTNQDPTLDNTIHTHPKDWAINCMNTYYIPASGSGNVNMASQGAIHLRRLISHIKFEITAGEQMKGLEVLSYHVFNLPRYSYLYEQNGNVSDIATAETKDQYSADAFFNEQYIHASESKNKFEFDFWQTENKHTATGNLTSYNDREKKSADGLLFTSLTGDAWTSKNLASYVVIRANVIYPEQIESDDSGYIPGDERYDENTSETVYRTAVAEYTIHLGYENDDLKDFNSYRNCDYIYKVTVNGLHDIIVEANRVETKDGVEGIVTDVTNPVIHLDAHFHVFNVVFSEEEMMTANPDDPQNNAFGYIVTTYRNGIAYSFNESSTVSADDRMYIDWIELKPTTDVTTLADYVPAKGTLPSGKTENDRVMPIDNFYKKVCDNRNDLSKVFTPITVNNVRKYYFTVFVNEYTYEPRYGEDNYGDESKTPSSRSWNTYVNQPARHFYFRVKRKESDDNNSIYARSKYAFEQQSIQSYYSNSGNHSQTAVGLEHTNETQGLNLRTYYVSLIANSLGNVNGRYNIERFMEQISGLPFGVDDNYNPIMTECLWTRFITPQKELVIPNVSNLTSAERLQNGPQILSVASGWNPASEDANTYGFTQLPAPNPINKMAWTFPSLSVGDLEPSSYDPQQSSNDIAHYIEAVNACMNRNRDENGNGIIDNAELKWYVPASGKYLRAILGRHSLSDPIMPYTSVTPKLPNKSNMYNSRYMMYSSDNLVVWAMEGLSLSTLGQFKDQGQQPPWQVRCIRNLGTNLTTIVPEDKVTMAYVPDKTNRIVRMTYYDQASIRTQKYTGSGNIADNEPNADGSVMPMHPVTSSINKVYYAFEYDDAVNNITIGAVNGKNSIAKSIIINNSESNTNPCKGKGDGWRLPNQKEIAIMRNLGLFDGMGGYALSCTYDYFDTDGNSLSSTSPYFFNTNGDAVRYLIGTRSDGGTRFEDNTTTVLHYRCVRDVEP